MFVCTSLQYIILLLHSCALSVISNLKLFHSVVIIIRTERTLFLILILILILLNLFFFLLLLFIHPFVFFSSSIPSIKYHSFYSFKKQSLALFDWTYTFTWLFINDDDDDDIMFFFNVLRFQAASSAESWKMTFCGSWWGMIKTIRNNRKTGKIHLKLIPSLKVKH